MKRVMFLAKPSVFWRGVERLLQNEAACDLVAWETDLEQALLRIHELRPDVVLVDGGNSPTPDDPLILRILGEGLGISVIALNLEHSTLSLYSRERRTVGEVQDLVQAIEQVPAASPQAGEEWESLAAGFD